MKRVSREMEEEGATGSKTACSEVQMKAIVKVVGNVLEKALKEAKKHSDSEGAISNRPSRSQVGHIR